MQFFANLGSVVEERWKENNYDEDRFPAIAAEALAEFVGAAISGGGGVELTGPGLTPT